MKPVWALLLTGALGACAAQAGSAPAADVEPVYAQVDWPAPLNPRFVTLGNDHFLLATRSGMQVWDANANRFFPAPSWPRHTSLERNWVRLAGGTVVGGGAHTDADVPYESLIWWNPQAGNFSAPLLLTPGAWVQALVPVDAQYALACLGVRAADRPAEAPTTSALLFDIGAGMPRLVAATPATRALLAGAGVRGPVDGAAIGDEPGTTPPPVTFNTATCLWEMRNRPALFDGMVRLSIKHHRLPDGRVLVSQASWYDPANSRHGNLGAPLLWEPATAAWRAIDATAQPGTDGGTFHNYDVDQPVVSVPAISARFVEFLDARTLRWTRSQQTLPDTYSPGVAPLAGGDALVFLREEGRILRVNPMSAPAPGAFAYRHSYFGAVELRNGDLLLMGGGDRWHPQNRPELLSGQQARQIAPLPALWGYVSGVELADRSILVFGGLPPRCDPSAKFSECKNAAPQPAYRYFPAQDRWQVVPGLALPFDNGQFWDTGNSGIATQWPRNDAIVRRNGDFVFLQTPPAYRRADDDPSRHASTLVRWSPRAASTALAPLLAGRSEASLLELNDRRLVAVGGMVQSGAKGKLDWASSTEVYSDKQRRWRAGPRAHHGGGRAVKLANGRVFKLSITDLWFAESGYRAEMADAAFTRWQALPPFPVKPFKVRHVGVAGNRVLLLPEAPSDQTVVWDDKRHAWRVWPHWPGGEPLSVTPVDARRAMVRYADSFKTIGFPER